MSGASSLLLVIDFICICVGLAGIIAGGVGHSWWKSEILGGKIEEGLWRRCTDTLVTSSVACSRREDILKFKAAGGKFSYLSKRQIYKVAIITKV